MLASPAVYAAAAALPTAVDGLLVAPPRALAPASSDVLRLAQVSDLVSPYLWSASKAADGTISFAGHVPSKDVQDSLRDNVPKFGTDTTSIATGEPQGFVANAVGALDVLAALDSGKVAFDGGTWIVTGNVKNADKATAAKAAFDNSPLKAIGASYVVLGPDAVETTPAVLAPNYAWSAEKAGDGTVTFNGTVPNDQLQRFLVSHVGGKALDNSTVAAGAPEGFVSGTLYGLDALLTLQSGKLLFAAGAWSLAGIASDEAAKEAAHAALAAVDTKDWHFDLKIPTRPIPPPVSATTEAPAAAAAEPAAAEPAKAEPTKPEPAAPEAAAAEPAPIPAEPAKAKPAPAEPARPAPAEAAVPVEAPKAVDAAAPAATPATTPYLFQASKALGATIVANGQVPTEAVKTYLGNVSRDPAATGVSVVPGAPDHFAPDLLGGIDALARMTSGTLDFDGSKWTIKGRTETGDLEAIVVSRLALLPDAKTWTVEVSGPTPLELCTKAVAAMPEGGINFERGTKFAKGTQAIIDALATGLAICPEVRVNVEAFTDSDGDKDANMALSVARAEAVVDELVQRGISPDRIYAIGYGETLPLVENTTKANKAKNRRVEIKLGDLDAK